MLLRFFRSTGSQMIVFIPLLALFLWLPALFYPSHYILSFGSLNMPFYQLVVKVLKESSFVGTFITLTCIVIQGFLLVRLNTRFIFINNRSYLPAFFFVILTSSVKIIQTLNPAVFAGFFLLLALEKLFDSFRHEKLSYEVFTASFFISAATFFYPFAIFLILFVWIGLVVLRPFNWREWAFTIIGLIIPFFLLDSYYYLLVSNIHIVYNSFFDSFTVVNEKIQYKNPIIFLSIYLAFLMVLSSQYLLNTFQGKKILQRKAFTLFFWLFASTLAMYLIIPQTSAELVYFLAIPISYLLANYFVFIKSNFWGNILLITLFVLIIWNQFSR